ncbi:phage holin family protein [Paraoerskovia marina]|uniref:4 TMS phage holin, superfamily IV n=1 Tax=Paraoerskovia marina TaxID=545619 RepID=A0A1H1W2T9_9CELL|nr:phage holin family protein [Paraoerskovia marina]SDS91030.1 4 TMS phage holin, superfamily IV [Paraoerskovia marina]
MVKFLLRTLVFVLAAAVGIVLTDWIFGIFDLSTFDVHWSDPVGFILAIVIFALAQAILSPFIAKAARNNAPALLGGVGLLSTFIALLIAALVSDGLEIGGWAGWILGPIIVWLVSMVATLVLPVFLLKEGAENRKDGDD